LAPSRSSGSPVHESVKGFDFVAVDVQRVHFQCGQVVTETECEVSDRGDRVGDSIEVGGRASAGTLQDYGLYAFEWGDRIRILGGFDRAGQVTPPVCSRTRSL
jgi:hypothetical protein